MADLPQAGQPQPQPGASQGASGGSAFGSAPAPGAVPNQGQSAAGMAVMAVLQKGTLMAIQMVGPSSPAGADLRKSLDLISKHVPAGAVSPATESNVLKAMLTKLQQNTQQIAAMQQGGQRQMAGGQPPQPQPGAMPGGAAPQQQAA